MYEKQALVALVRQKALKFGQFTLASGKKATYYLDGKQVTLDPAGAVLVAKGILNLLARGPLPEAIGGMSIGADPITAAVVTMSGVRGTPITGFMVRKQSKGHGTNQYIEGPVQPGQRVVIVEDVVTTGGSSLEAIERVEAFGLKVAQVVAIIDRPRGRGRGLRRPRLSLRQPAEHRGFRHPAAAVGPRGCHCWLVQQCHAIPTRPATLLDKPAVPHRVLIPATSEPLIGLVPAAVFCGWYSSTGKLRRMISRASAIEATSPAATACIIEVADGRGFDRAGHHAAAAGVGRGLAELAVLRAAADNVDRFQPRRRSTARTSPARGGTSWRCSPGRSGARRPSSLGHGLAGLAAEGADGLGHVGRGQELGGVGIDKRPQRRLRPAPS